MTYAITHIPRYELHRRGWSDKQIRTLLPEPHVVTITDSDSRLWLWSLAEVDKLEDSPIWHETRAKEEAWKQTVPWWYWSTNLDEWERLGTPKHACGHYVGMLHWEDVPEDQLSAITEEPCSFCLETSRAKSPTGLEMEYRGGSEDGWLHVTSRGEPLFKYGARSRSRGWAAIWVYPDGEVDESGPFTGTCDMDFAEDNVWREVAAIKLNKAGAGGSSVTGEERDDMQLTSRPTPI